MFRCLECGEAFKFPREIEEAHGEKWYLCPHCGENHYKPFVRDEISRREVLEKLCEAMMLLNCFDSGICGVFNSVALEKTDFDFARSELYDAIVYVAGDSEFDLPSDITDKICEMKTQKDTSEVFEKLTYNIER